MIAKVTSGGNGVSGLLNYIMEGKHEGRGAEQKRAELMAHSDNLIPPMNYRDREGTALLKREFINRIEDYKREKGSLPKSKVLGHHVLSFTRTDEQSLRKEGIKEAVRDYAKLSGFAKTQYVAYAHSDTRHYHVHLVFSKIQNNGTLHNSWQEKSKATQKAAAITIKNELALVGDMKKVGASKEVMYLRSQMDDIPGLKQLSPELAQARNLHHLEKLCEKSGTRFSNEYINLKVGKHDISPLNAEAVFLSNRLEQKTARELVKGQDRSKTRGIFGKAEEGQSAELSKESSKGIQTPDQPFEGIKNIFEKAWAEHDAQRAKRKKEPDYQKKKRKLDREKSRGRDFGL